MIAVTPNNELVDAFHGSGGEGKPCLAQRHVSLAATIDEARDNAWRWWPHGVMPPALLGELSQPKEFEVAATAIGPQPISKTVVCTSDAGPIGPDQQRLADACATELLPHYGAGKR